MAIFSGLVACALLAAHARDTRAEEQAGACPSVTQDYCKRVDLSEVCGPGCYVELIGDKETDE